MDPDRLTNRQLQVLEMRYERDATLEQMARWLGISRRAVLYRLQNARKRAAVTPDFLKTSLDWKQKAAPSRSRTYSSSQVRGEAESTDFDQL